MLSYPPSLNVSGFIKLIFAFVCLASLVLLFNFPARAAAAGDFDSSFHSDGRLGMSEPHYFNDLALQPDGKILALGRTRTGAPGEARFPISVMRFEADGSVDASFGSSGILRPQFGANIVERASFARQPDGKIVLAGVTANNLGGVYTLVVFRYLADGQPDSGFGSGGSVALGQNGVSGVTEVLIQPDGKILFSAHHLTGISNSYLWRLNPNGAPDADFGNGGVVTPGIDPALNHTPATPLLQPDGKILVVGTKDTVFFLARYHANGSLDASFGNGGRVVTQIQDRSGANDAAFQPDGKIVVVGYSRDSANYVTNMAMARYTADGALDASFGANGIVFTNFGAGLYSTAYGVVIQPNGKIIICGFRSLPQFESAAMLARYHQTGALDASFGVGGYVLSRFSSIIHAENYNMAIQPDGKLVTVGAGIYDKYSASATMMRLLLNGQREYDFDGDRKADVSIFRPNSAAEWYWLNSSNNQSSGLQFGNNSDKPVPADYDGDGKSDVSVFRAGDWYRINSSDNSFVAVHFGQSGDVPVPADYDADSKADLAVFRAGNWYILNSSDNSFRAEQFGTSTDKPVIGDFDGDGKSDLAVYRDGVWYAQRSRDGFFGAQFGIDSDKPVAADYDSDGKTDLAVYRPSDGTWYLQRSYLGFTAMQFGISTDKPVPADYDNDGKTDIAVFREGVWYLQQSTAGFRTIQFGAAGDVPVPATFVP